jgi:sarcosine oxidase
MTVRSDVLVVGLGAMGSAALYQLARRGIAVTGIDRFTPPHDRGSSHGESRITRQAIGEGEEYVPFALRSHEIWRELEADTGRSLFSPIGGLIIGQRGQRGRPTDAAMIHGQADFIGRTIAAAKRFHIEHEVLALPKLRSAFAIPACRRRDLLPNRAPASFDRTVRCAGSIGAELGAYPDWRAVARVTADATSVTVVTNAATYTPGASS